MGKLHQIARCFLLSITLIWNGIFNQSCIFNDDFSDCIEDKFLLYIKVIDAATGQDVTESYSLDEVDLYFFHPDEGYLERHMVIPGNQIAQREPIVFNHTPLSRFHISSWGNLGNQINISNTNEGNGAADLSVSLIRDPNQTAYDLSPEDFFFGNKEIDWSKGNTDEVVLTQKNAKLYITVRGLKETNTNKYYFKILNPFNGYNFNGTPLRTTSTIRKEGRFNDRFEYISQEPYLLIHSDNLAQERNALQLQLYKKEDRLDKEIVSTKTDIMGNYLTLASGKTTNVLIEITENEALLSVLVQVTPWDVIHQWSEY